MSTLKDLKEELGLHIAERGDDLTSVDFLIIKCMHFLEDIEDEDPCIDDRSAGRIVSSMDQMVMHSREFARALIAYRETLLESGMTLNEVQPLMLNFNHLYWTSEFMS